MEIVHKRSRIIYSVTPHEVTELEDENHNYHHHGHGDQIQYGVVFTYQTKYIFGYGHVLDTDSPEGTITDVEFSESKEATSPLLSPCNFENFDDLYMLLAPTLSEMGVKRQSVQNDIVKSVVDCGQRIINDHDRLIKGYSSTGNGLIVSILVEMEKEKERWLCDRATCMAEMAWRECDNIADAFLDVCKVREGEKELGDTCSVCLEQYGVGSCAARMPDCMHMFHENCIVTWLRQDPSCPVCRSRLFGDYL